MKKEHPTVLMASFDLTPLTIELLKEQTIALSLDQQPFLQGYMAIAQLNLHARFAFHPANIDSGTAVIDANRAIALAELVRIGVR